jgi:uncharacterized membrane protein
MKNTTDILIWVVGLLAIVLAVWQAFAFLGAKDPRTGVPDMMWGVNHLWLAILMAIVSIACIVIYFVRHPRVEEEIHISQ